MNNINFPLKATGLDGALYIHALAIAILFDQFGFIL
jgi:hypothetical protein